MPDYKHHISPDIQNIVAEALVGASGTQDQRLCEEYGIDPADLEDLMLSNDVERCEECGWWVESSEINTEDEPDAVICRECRPQQ